MGKKPEKKEVAREVKEYYAELLKGMDQVNQMLTASDEAIREHRHMVKLHTEIITLHESRNKLLEVLQDTREGMILLKRYLPR